MPRKDGTGPMGAGSMTGRGFGLCKGANAEKPSASCRLRRRSGCGRGPTCKHGFDHGFGRSFPVDEISPEMRKKLLDARKSILQWQLEAIDKQLSTL